jgi:hypothetical protein
MSHIKAERKRETPCRRQQNMANTIAQQTKARVIIALTIIGYIIFLTAYLKRRNLFPISQRYPYLVFTEAIILVVIALMNLLVVAFNDDEVLTNCQVYMGIVGIGDFTSISAMTYRMTIVVFKHIASTTIKARRSNWTSIQLLQKVRWNLLGKDGLAQLARINT